MDPLFTIDIWSDVVCPFCYLGKRQLELALARFEHADVVVMQFRAFELDPRARTTYDRPLDELVARKYGIEPDRAREMHRRLEGEAAQLGMTWSLDRARPTNTFDAHRLIALASNQGRGAVMADRLFRAYFCDGELVSDHDTLVRLADEVGVDGITAVLDSQDFADEVRADEADALELGFSGVPAMVLDRRFVVNGAQGVDTLVDVLNRAWARRSVA